METFKSALPEEILQILTNFDIEVVRMGTASTKGKIAFMRTLLRGKAQREYDLIIATFGGTTATHQQEIRKGLLKHLFPSNALAKQKRAMRRMIIKPRGTKLR